MSTYSLSDTDAIAAGRIASASQWRGWLRVSGAGIVAALAWTAFGLSCLIWEDIGDWLRTQGLGISAFVIAAAVLLGTLSGHHLGSVGRAVHQRAPWLVASGVFLTLWELATAKFA